MLGSALPLTAEVPALGTLLAASPMKTLGIALAAAVIAYFCGWLQLMLVMGISPEAAFLAGVAPFVVVDVLKILAAVACARAVKAAVR